MCHFIFFRTILILLNPINLIFILFQNLEVNKILELRSPIVQISLSPNEVDGETKILVSTETNTIICDSARNEFIEIGNVQR